MKRLKFLCSLLLICFFVALFQDVVMSALQGFNLGYNMAGYEIENALQSETFTSVSLEPKYNEIVPADVNQKDGSPLLIVPQKASLVVFRPAGDTDSPTSWNDIALDLFHLFVSLAICGGFVFLLVVVVKIIVSFHRSQIFDERNIRRFRIIGIGFLVLALLGTIYNGMELFFVNRAIELVDYDISARFIDWDDLIIGLIILLMNEVLQIATQMKNEHDLTI
ncbi:MAG: DUF2975 domain-containing protein [Paludibacteraceae bacterium]